VAEGSPLTWRDWLQGARLRTLPLALSPIILGSASALWQGDFSATIAGLALLVALALQVGVNFANDYSDGIRGTDDYRVGPTRLVASGKVEPRKVLQAALGAFGLAGVAGVVLLVLGRLDVLLDDGFLGWLASVWPVLALGVIALVAAWFYTGGAKPYGYRGFW